MPVVDAAGAEEAISEQANPLLICPLATIAEVAHPKVVQDSAELAAQEGLAVGSDRSSGAVRVLDGVLIEELPAGGAVLLNSENEQYFNFDAMAASMWAALTSSPTIDGAVQLLLAEYEVDEKTLRADIEQFVDNLADRGLVDLVEE